jgi:hypothetical protein
VGPFTALIELYPEVIEFINNKNPNISRPITVDFFKSLLLPIKNIDWLDSTLNRRLKGRQSNVKYLTNWMLIAIMNEEEYSVEEILSESLPSLAGRGILSKPERKVFDDADNWFSGDQATFSMPRPLHAQKAGWDIKYFKRGETSAYKLNVPKGWQKLSHTSVILNLKKSDISADAQNATIDRIIVQGCWTNELGDSAYSIHTMTNPR